MADFELISEYHVPAKRLFDLVSAPAFQEAIAFRFGAFEASVTALEKKGDMIHMKIERADPGRDFAGGLVRGKEERSIIIHDWNRKSLTSRWSRHYLNRGQLVTVEGTVCVEAKGEEACRLVERGIVDIKVPLLGRKLERKIIEALKEMQPKRVDFIMSQLGLHE